MRTTEPSFFDTLVSQNVRERRKALGISMKYVAQNVEPPVSLSLVHGWENYRWRIPTEHLLQLAEILQCTLLDLLICNQVELPVGKVTSQLSKLNKIRRGYKDDGSSTSRKVLPALKRDGKA